MFDFDSLRNSDKIAVHCPDVDIAIAFVRDFKEKFPKRYFYGNPGASEYWYEYEEETCYSPYMKSNSNITYCDIKYYEEHGYKIINAADLIKKTDIGEFSPSDVDMKCLFGME